MRTETIKFTVNTSKLNILVSLIKSISKFLYTATNPANKLEVTPSAVDLAMDLLLSRPAKTLENQSITNLKP